MPQPESLLEYALTEIRDRIQTGVYPPGKKLSTQEISESLGISRTPVVSAVNRLVAEGLAEAIPRRGVYVTPLSEKKIRDMLEVRMMIELYAIKPAIRNVDYYPDVIEEMEGLIEKIEALGEEGSEVSYKAASEYESRFHYLYVTLAGNDQLTKMFVSNWSVGAIYYIYSRTKMPLSRQKKAYHEHRAIVRYLTEKNEIALRNLLEEHIQVPLEALDFLVRNDTQNLFRQV